MSVALEQKVHVDPNLHVHVHHFILVQITYTQCVIHAKLTNASRSWYEYNPSVKSKIKDLDMTTEHAHMGD